MLKEYVVLFVDRRNPDVLEVFLCEAEDGNHAEEQGMDAYPNADIVWVQKGSDWQDAQANYWVGYVTRGHR
jgi:hypothetical protein